MNISLLILHKNLVMFRKQSGISDYWVNRRKNPELGLNLLYNIKKCAVCCKNYGYLLTFKKSCVYLFIFVQRMKLSELLPCILLTEQFLAGPGHTYVY